MELRDAKVHMELPVIGRWLVDDRTKARHVKLVSGLFVKDVQVDVLHTQECIEQSKASYVPELCASESRPAQLATEGNAQQEILLKGRVRPYTSNSASGI